MAANRKATRLNDSKFSYVDARDILDAEHIYVGNMVQQDDVTKEVAMATSAVAKLVLGVATEEVDNADDGLTIKDISTAIHLMVQANTITKDEIGDVCYVVDEATVTGVSGFNAAGRVVEVPTSGTVYVDFDPAKRG
jgi:hypothetical protein